MFSKGFFVRLIKTRDGLVKDKHLPKIEVNIFHQKGDITRRQKFRMTMRTTTPSYNNNSWLLGNS